MLLRLKRVGTFLVIIFLMIVITVLSSQLLAFTTPILGPDNQPLAGSIATIEKVKLGGVSQWLVIRSKNADNPVLLFLSGGPGGSELGRVRNFNTPLEDRFTLVVWEQRGCGKSYTAITAKSGLTVNQYVADTIELSEMLRTWFNAEKIYLMGHSWGSIIGVLAAQQRPDLYYAYIGSGQTDRPAMASTLPFRQDGDVGGLDRNLSPGSGRLTMFARTPAISGSNSIALLEKVRLGSSDQWITIRGNDTHHPVLLYLAGGPGGGQLLQSRLYLSGLEDHFIVVSWDQPGSGKSYGAIPFTDLTIQRYVSDAYELVQMLRARFHYHSIHTPSIHEALDFFCQHAPPLHLHVVLLTRVDPPLCLPLLRARGQITELRGQDLRFNDTEAHDFFTQTMGLQLESTAAGKLTARTEGWIAGLQLAALSLQGCDLAGVDEFVSAFSGSDRYIMDYLLEQVLQRLPADLRTFLCQTAILERLCPSLCDALLSDSALQQNNSKGILAQLDQANLFLIRLDTQGQWYRYHHLFADLLKLELDPEHQIGLHQRASAWFEANGYLPEAIDHALAAGDQDTAARLICLVVGNLLARSEFQTVLGWIERLPTDLIRTNGDLAAHRALALFFTGEVEQAAIYLDQLDSVSTKDLSPLTHGRLLAVRAFMSSLQSNHPSARKLAQEALSLIAEDEPFYQMTALLPLGLAEDATGNTPAATQIFQDTYQLGQRTGHALAALGGLFVLAKNLLNQGRRRQALALCENALPRYQDRRGNPLPLSGLIYVPLSMAHYQSNDLDSAWECAVAGMRLSRQIISEDILGWDEERVIASIQFARGEVDAAMETARRIRKAAEETNYVRGIVSLRAFEAELFLRQGDLAPVRLWVEDMHYSPDDTPSVEHEMAYRIYARFLLAVGQPQEARSLLVTLEHMAQTGGRYGRLMTFRVLQSLTEEALGNHHRAIEYMIEAVRLASPEGFRRIFLDAGDATLSLLAQVRSIDPEFVDSLLRAGSVGLAPTQPSAETLAQSLTPLKNAGQGLAEPLTKREREVLNLLAGGLSYRQIAESLIIAMGTVRAHCSTIYSKLEVANRTQAILKAKEIGLLSQDR